MSTVFVYIFWDDTTIPVEIMMDIDTSASLIQKMIGNGQIPHPVPNRRYKLWDINDNELPETATLRELGVEDGDAVIIVPANKEKFS